MSPASGPISHRRRTRRVFSRRAILTTLVTAAVVVLIIQLFPPPAPRGVLPGDGVLADHVIVPESVNVLLRRACYDCHSDETRWPWYSRIAPVSWIIANDVQHGRSNLDFSSWSTHPYREPTPDQRLRWMCREVREGFMPPPFYRLVHPEARLTDGEQETLCAWTKDARDGLR